MFRREKSKVPFLVEILKLQKNNKNIIQFIDSYFRIQMKRKNINIVIKLFSFLWNYFSVKISFLTRMHSFCICTSFTFASAASYSRPVAFYLHPINSNDFRWNYHSPFSSIIFIRSLFPSLHLSRSPISFIELEDERERKTDGARSMMNG